MADQRNRSTQSQYRRNSNYYQNGSTKKKSKKNNDNSRITKVIIRLLIVIVLVLAMVAAYRNRIDLSCANMTQCGSDTMAMCGSGKGFPSTINGSRSLSIDTIADSGIALLSDTSLTIYDETAREAAVRAHFMSNPAMKVSGRYAVVFDLGSTVYRVESAADTITTGQAERPLISCAVSRSCHYALVMQGSSKGESWLSSIDVFDRSGESIHKWHCADWYITDAALSPDGKYLAMSGVNAAHGDLTSVIIIQQVGSKEQIAEYILSDNICMSLEYNNENTLFAVGSNALTVVTEKGTVREDITYNGTLSAYDVCYDSGAVICTFDELGTTARVFDAYGRERCSYRADGAIQNAALSDEACALLGDGYLNTIRLDGSLISRNEGNAALGGLLLINRTAYIVDGMHISSRDLH